MKNKVHKQKIIYDARYLIINTVIKNNSGEKIEYAELSPTLTLEFESSYKSLSPKDYTFVDSKYEQYWENGKNIRVEQKFLLNSSYGYDENIFSHKPKNVELILYLKAKNSVGYNNIVGGGGKKILKKEITEKYNF